LEHPTIHFQNPEEFNLQQYLHMNLISIKPTLVIAQNAVPLAENTEYALLVLVL
jgi:hypothetical protein